MSFKTEIIAHRGASWDAPENTVAAIRLAWTQQADGAECDVYVTADDAVVLLHDPTLKRTGGVDINVSEAPLAIVREADVGALKGAAWRGEKVPLIGEVLALLPEGKKLVVEIKGGPGVIPALKREVGKALASGLVRPGQVEFISFSEQALRAAKAAMPECRALYLSGDYKERSAEALEELIAICREAGFDGLDLDRGWPVSLSFVQRVHNAGLLLYMWTVNDPAKARDLALAGVDAIATDRPALVRAGLEGKA
ncbi:glycerophosphoryl diester phosphodiesterase [Opitutaceae bacterium TAV1]|nr:glycerophosphoryl diester phosphodiesterase [Opitutaceae bacterium TAV1]